MQSIKTKNKKKQTKEDIKPAPRSAGNCLFPVFLKLEQLHVLMVGAGKVGLEKLQALLTNAPATRISIVSTHISDEIKKLAGDYKLTLYERPFEKSDLTDIDIAVIAINDPAESSAIQAVCKAAGKLVNVADQPALCDFYLGSIVKKGDLKIGISTNGKSPTVAKRLKETLNDVIPDEIDQLLSNMQLIRNRMNGQFEEKVKKLNELTRSMVENENVEKKHWKKIARYSVIGFALMLIGHFIFSYLPLRDIASGIGNLYHSLDKSFPIMLLAGFLAQIVDGALGMGYGVTSATILLSAGVSPAAISGSIHTAEMFASGASGYSHYKFGNVNKKLFRALLIPGVIGAITGALLLVFLGDKYSQWVRPIIACYTLFLGIKFIINAFRPIKAGKKFKHYSGLAALGGFFDSFGGGGWGPIVTSTLINKGRSHKYVVGSVSLTEFFVTLASAFTFFTLIGVSHWQTIVALVVGGLIAAPLAARLAGKLPRKTSFLLLGFLVIGWSIRILIKII